MVRWRRPNPPWMLACGRQHNCNTLCPHCKRRLKAEVDRQAASPALCLLDELMGILDPGQGEQPR